MLDLFKELLGNPTNVSDEVLQFYLDCARDIICDIRNTNDVEMCYENLQVKIAIEMYNKRGAEGEVSHTENGIARTYDTADVSQALLNQITPFVKTPFSVERNA